MATPSRKTPASARHSRVAAATTDASASAGAAAGVGAGAAGAAGVGAAGGDTTIASAIARLNEMKKKYNIQATPARARAGSNFAGAGGVQVSVARPTC